MSSDFLKLFSLEHMMVAEEELTQKQLFDIVAQQLEKEGFARSGYCQKLLEREQIYPTGLKLASCNVAIPHISNDEVLKSAIYVSLLKHPIEWHSMENPEEKIPVSLVFNICLAEKEKQVAVLSDIIALIQKKEATDSLIRCSSSDQMMEIIRKEEEER